MYFPSLLFLFIIIFFLQYHSTPCFASRKLKNNNGNKLDENPNIDFINQSCNSTLYPQLCYSTFCNFSTQTNPKREIACLALTTTLSEAKFALAIAKKVATKGKAYAKKDCISVLKDSHEQLMKSVQEMERVDPEESDFRFRVSNVQTWVSAALTDACTCTDGIKEGQNSSNNNKTQDYKKVREEVVKFSHLTSITLAFINNYATSC